jgi:hypothetical protein
MDCLVLATMVSIRSLEASAANVLQIRFGMEKTVSYKKNAFQAINLSLDNASLWENTVELILFGMEAFAFVILDII